MFIGLGTGTTARYVPEELGRRIREEGLRVRGVPTSDATARLATDLGIPPAPLSEQIDVDIDGADEVDTRGSLT
jgi:ribose 5-phosphate isomerase A